jgi:hypothetical protein
LVAFVEKGNRCRKVAPERVELIATMAKSAWALVYEAS